MIRTIIDNLNTQLVYSFQETLLGVVHPHDNKGKVIPVVSDGSLTSEAVPDSLKESIVYWEDYGARTTLQTPRFRWVDHTMRLVVWLNFNKINDSYENCVEEMVANFPMKHGNAIAAITGQVPKNNDVFARYSYQDRKQYITWPYDAFALEVLVKYPDFGCKPIVES